MNPTHMFLVFGIVVAVDLCVVPMIIFAMINGYWGDLAKKFPGRTPASDAVRREFQSINIDVCSFGFGTHIAVDETHLHLQPAMFLRWFKASPISIPWEAIENVKPSWPRSSMKATVGGTKFAGPKWALEVAMRPSTEAHEKRSSRA